MHGPCPRPRAANPPRYTYSAPSDPKWARLLASWSEDLPKVPTRARTRAACMHVLRCCLDTATYRLTANLSHISAQVRARLGCEHEWPLLWTADFILDTAPDGSDAYKCAGRGMVPACCDLERLRRARPACIR